MIEVIYNLNMVPDKGSPIHINVSQNDDKCRTFIFKLYSSDGSWTAPASATSTIEGRKDDGKFFSFACTYSNGEVTVIVQQQMVAVAGKVRCKIKLVSGAETIESAPFYFVVNPKSMPVNADMSKSDVVDAVAKATQKIVDQVAENIPEDYVKLNEDVSGLKQDKIGWEKINFIDNHYIALGDIGDIRPLDTIYINNMCCVSVDCEYGDIFFVKGVGGNLPKHFGFVDANNKVLMVSNNFDPNNVNIGTELVAPQNATKLIVNCRYEYDYFLYKGLKNDNEKGVQRYNYLINKIADISGITTNLTPDYFKLSYLLVNFEGKSMIYCNNSVHLCLKNQFMFDLKVGDIISLQSYQVYKLYIYKLEENNFNFIGWKYSDFAVLDSGKYGFVVSRQDENVISQAEIKTIISLISIIRPSNKIQDIKDKLSLGAMVKVISASDSLDDDKKVSDYVCTGTGDGIIIQSAINELVELGGGKIILKKGRYYLDKLGFKDSQNQTYGNSLILCNVKDKCVTIESEIVNQNDPVSAGQEANTGAQLYVTNGLYESMSNDEIYSIFNCAGLNYEGGIILKNFGIVFPYNQKKIIGLDMLHFNGICRAEGIYVNAYNKTYNAGGSISAAVTPAVDGCIGIRTICKTSIGAIGTQYSNCIVKGCYDGFAINSEHIILNECAAIFCVYGYSFLKYRVGNGQHPNLLLRCMDERNVNLPKFYNNANGQCNIILGLNIERKPSITPGGKIGLFATEEVVGQNRGEITYTITDESSNNVKDNVQFWEYGHGHGFASKNLHHLQSCNTATRLSYAPNFMQRIFDTDLHKEVICIDESTKTWVDCLGNKV